MRQLDQNVEALIFASEAAVSSDELIASLKAAHGWELTREDITDAIGRIKEKYVSEDFSFELNEIAGGYEFLSKKDFHPAIHVMLQLKEKKRLSTAALETLAIIAYKQPITKPELEQIRGVSCDYSIQKLLEKDLIVISGKSDGPGKPILYSTSKNFMDHFGLRSVKDLPKLKDIQPGAMSEIGTPLEMMEDIPVDLAPEEEGEAVQVAEVSFDSGIQEDTQEPENEGSDQTQDEQQ